METFIATIANIKVLTSTLVSSLASLLTFTQAQDSATFGAFELPSGRSVWQRSSGNFVFKQGTKNKIRPLAAIIDPETMKPGSYEPRPSYSQPAR